NSGARRVRGPACPTTGPLAARPGAPRRCAAAADGEATTTKVAADAVAMMNLENVMAHSLLWPAPQRSCQPGSSHSRRFSGNLRREPLVAIRFGRHVAAGERPSRATARFDQARIDS